MQYTPIEKSLLLQLIVDLSYTFVWAAKDWQCRLKRGGGVFVVRVARVACFVFIWRFDSLLK
jgi:hypothetical protein